MTLIRQNPSQIIKTWACGWGWTLGSSNLGIYDHQTLSVSVMISSGSENMTGVKNQAEIWLWVNTGFLTRFVFLAIHMLFPISIDIARVVLWSHHAHFSIRTSYSPLTVPSPLNEVEQVCSLQCKLWGRLIGASQRHVVVLQLKRCESLLGRLPALNRRGTNCSTAKLVLSVYCP